MAKLTLINSTIGAEFEIHNINLAEVTPNDILRCEELNFSHQSYTFYRREDDRYVKGKEMDKNLKDLGFKDGDKIEVIYISVLA